MALKPAAFARAIADGTVVLDTRSPEAFAGGHVPGALNVGLGAAFATWAGTVLDEGAAVAVVLDSPADLWTAVWELLRIGYDVPAGWLAGGMMAWRTGGHGVGRLRQIGVDELRTQLEAGDIELLDVRQPAEWAEGHVPGATFITGGELPTRLDDISASSKPLAVACGSGYRSSVAASVLARDGRREVLNTIGGMSAWNAAGFPTTKER